MTAAGVFLRRIGVFDLGGLFQLADERGELRIAMFLDEAGADLVADCFEGLGLRFLRPSTVQR